MNQTQKKKPQESINAGYLCFTVSLVFLVINDTIKLICYGFTSQNHYIYREKTC